MYDGGMGRERLSVCVCVCVCVCLCSQLGVNRVKRDHTYSG